MARMVKVRYRQGLEFKSRNMGVPDDRDEREYVRDLNQMHIGAGGMWDDTVLVPYHQIEAYELRDGKAKIIAELV